MPRIDKGERAPLSFSICRKAYGEAVMTLHLPVPVITVLLLIGSNIFMTYAWYGHLRHQSLTFVGAILVSWGIASINGMIVAAVCYLIGHARKNR